MRVDIGKMQVLCLVFLSLLSLCCGRVRHLPEGEPTGHGNGTMVKLRMPGIAPKKVFLQFGIDISSINSYL